MRPARRAAITMPTKMAYRSTVLEREEKHLRFGQGRPKERSGGDTDLPDRRQRGRLLSPSAAQARLAMLAQRSWFGVPDDDRIAEALEFVRAALERTQAVADQLIGLNLHDAIELAARSGRQLRVVKRDGKGLTVTADLATNRIGIETQGDIVVAAHTG
jgi:hypothetical protein